ncbi:MAG: hypothetical protein IH598_14525 [Bacteroidales bacterium]|nr:hypothetical protein [Bacteroidales bacterium]
MGIRRYPGATPFSRTQSNIFYGRDKDIDKLLTLIQVEKKVLLYSKSGLGKTSLLEAGVLPKLPKSYTTISIRLFAYRQVSKTPTKDEKNESVAVTLTEDEKKELKSETPLERVISALKKVVDDLDTRNDTIIDQIIGDNEQDKTLWYYFKKAQLLAQKPDNDDSEKVFTLVFDQFEELFSFPRKDIDDFKNQLYELTELKLPDRVAVLIAEGRQNNRELFSRETIGLLHKKIEIKTIFAIRSDRLSLLNNLSDKLPDIQNTFYELLPLDFEQARQAIVNPASDGDPGFETPPFTFHNDAIDKIINELSDGGSDTIETTQLQIVCHRIEEIAAAKTTDEKRQIEVEDLPEFKNIFLNFYFDSINKLDEENQDKAKRLIEDELIRNHQRISLDQEICKEYLGEKELRELVDTHLLRAERNTFGRFSYEISHDTLVQPILESQKEYRDELERIRLEKERQEELRKLKEQQELEAREREAELKRIREEQALKEAERQRKIKQQRKTLQIVSIFGIISLIAAAFGFWQMNIAREQGEIARDAYSNFLKSQYEKNFDDGKAFESKAKYPEAIVHFEQALEFLKQDTAMKRIYEPEVIKRINISKDRLNSKSSHDSLINRADSFRAQKEYLLAMAELNEAFKLSYDTIVVQQKRADLYRHAGIIYQKDLDDYERMYDDQLEARTREKIQLLNETYNNIDR